MNLHSARRLAEAAGGDTPAALASVLADMLTTLGPEYVDAMKAALGGGAAPSTAAYHTHATRGATGQRLLAGHEREELDAAMGMGNLKARPPERRSDGTFVLHTMKPSDVRRLMAQGKL